MSTNGSHSVEHDDGPSAGESGGAHETRDYFAEMFVAGKLAGFNHHKLSDSPRRDIYKKV